MLGVKAIDSVLQYSANATTAAVTVTSDANSFFIAEYKSTSPTLTNMAAYTLGRDDPHTYYITDDNVSWNDKFPNAMDTYTDPLYSYHNSITSTWLGEGEDFGQLLGGNWLGEVTVEALTGTLASYLGLSSDGSAWTYTAELSQKANARFARIKHEALTTGTMRVTVPTQTIRLDAVPREEVGNGTSSASDPVTVVLENQYIAVKKLTITPQGTTARSATFDNVVVGPGLVNGGFEDDPMAGWALVQGTGTFSRDIAIKHDGQASLKFDGTTTDCAAGCLALPVTPGQVIKMRAWVYASGAAANGFYMRLFEKATYPVDGYVTSALYDGFTELYANAALVSGWQLKEGSYTVPAGTYWVSLCFYHWTGLSGIQLNIDTVEIDNNAFDVYVFDNSGAKIASAFQYSFQGV